LGNVKAATERLPYMIEHPMPVCNRRRSLLSHGPLFSGVRASLTERTEASQRSPHLRVSCHPLLICSCCYHFGHLGYSMRWMEFIADVASSSVGKTPKGECSE
jgi:hypothetical protein